MNVDLFKTSLNVDLMRLFKISSNKSWESVGAHGIWLGFDWDVRARDLRERDFHEISSGFKVI